MVPLDPARCCFAPTLALASVELRGQRCGGGHGALSQLLVLLAVPRECQTSLGAARGLCGERIRRSSRLVRLVRDALVPLILWLW
eukprot:SAG25_NODE_8670_length_410_cov_0.668810_1_plen_84_part_10